MYYAQQLKTSLNLLGTSAQLTYYSIVARKFGASCVKSSCRVVFKKYKLRFLSKMMIVGERTKKSWCIFEHFFFKHIF